MHVTLSFDDDRFDDGTSKEECTEIVREMIDYDVLDIANRDNIKVVVRDDEPMTGDPVKFASFRCGDDERMISVALPKLCVVGVLNWADREAVSPEKLIADAIDAHIAQLAGEADRAA